MMYDIIGDIHGYADELIELLIGLGYKKKEKQKNSFYQHPTNKVIFLGDFIDRGPKQRETLEIVMSMVKQGAALTVMGNHELNAIAYHTLKKDNSAIDAESYLRPHSNKNHHQHQAFLTAYPDVRERSEIIDWFKTLPLWLDLGELRIIHACWQPTVMDRVQKKLQGNTLNQNILHEALTYKTPLFADIETLLKGVEIALPESIVFTDDCGNERINVRVRWWLQSSNNKPSLRQAIIDECQPPVSYAKHDPFEQPIEDHILPGYQQQLVPCFIGHYWFHQTPSVVLSNLACLDYSVAKNGKLVAYRFKGETELNNEHFFWISSNKKINKV